MVFGRKPDTETQRRRARKCAPAAALLAFCFAAGAAAAADIQYTVAMPQPETHYFEVSARIQKVQGPSLRLHFPAWTPGSYMVREYARHVQDFEASAAGRKLDWRKTDKDTWEITTGGATMIEVKYRVYANELGVRSSDLDADHGYFNGATLFMYPDNRKNEPYRLTLKPQPGWKIATGLEPVAGAANTFEAADYDILLDSPVEMSAFELLEFEVRGVPHRIAIHGPTKFDRAALLRDTRNVVEEQAEIFREIPYKHYTFILHMGLGAGGGLEHLNSTSVNSRLLSLRREQDWHTFMDLMSHEFFHVWNIKRIRPEGLGPFDYTQEVYTPSLWISEGLTDYYGTLTLVRAGVMSPKEYFKRLAELIQSYRETPGRLVQSAEESSFDTWIKFYRRDENSLNSQISYYDKGALLGLMLDLEIRAATRNAKSLDDVMRALNDNYAKKGRGFPDDDFQKVVEQVAGRSFDAFFRDYVRGVAELPLEKSLALAGLTLGPKPMPAAPEDREKRDTVYLGATVRETPEGSGRSVISTVLAGSPAYEAGLNANDELLAFDGSRVTFEDYLLRLRDYKPGDTVEVAVFRDAMLRSFRVKLAAPRPPLQITQQPGVSAAQKALLEAWLEQPFQ